MKRCNMNIQILITFSLTLMTCFGFDISNAVIPELHPKYLAHVIYDGNCTIDDVDPESLKECAMYTCWKSPTTGVKIIQKSGCDEKAFCDDVNRSIVSKPDKEWPNCCPPPKCTNSEETFRPVPPEQHANVIYRGNCTREDIDPEIFKECAMYTCWKSPTTGVKIIQKSGCDEKAFCDDVNRSIVSEPDKEWPNCCPPPKCTNSEESFRPVYPGQLANVLYSGNCTREDIDPEIFNECAMYTCWKCPKTGIKIMQKSGCDEEAICNDWNRRSLFNPNKQWPNCCSRSKCPNNGGPVELDELAHVIYTGNCTRADVDPELFTECALHTCWKNPDNGYIAMQRFGCNEDVPCGGLHRNDIIRWDSEWPGCCPSPVCLEESVWRFVNN